MNEQVIIAFSSCPDETSAAALAKTLVAEGLAACVNRLPGLHSTYVWDGVLKDEAEVLLIIKTVAATLPALSARLVELHPYEVPELVSIAVDAGNEPYLAWVRRCVRRDERGGESGKDQKS
jgi:periplasmic divalent cation tolerance protein